MDNQGTPAPRNSQSIRTFVANQKAQDPSECWPFQVRYDYSDILNQSCRVRLSNRQVPENVEAPESTVARRNTEGENVVDENHRGAEFEQDRQLDVGTVEPLESFIRRNIVDVNLDTPALLTVAGLSLEYYERQKEAESKAAEGNGCPKVGHIQPLKINGKRKFKGKKQKMAEPDVATGTFINCSSDTDESGRNISDPEPTDSMPRQGQSSRGRVLKPTQKLLQLESSTGAPAGEGTSRSERKQPKMRLLKPTLKLPQLANSTGAPAGEGTSGAGEGTSGSERKQPKVHWLKAVTARATSMPRIPAETEGNQHNRLQSGVDNPNGSGIGVEVGVSEPSGSVSVAGQASQANGVAPQADVVNPDGSGVGGSGPTEPTSAAGQAVGHQTDMVVPMLEPMVCVTNRNPMDFSIEEAKKYMRTE